MQERRKFSRIVFAAQVVLQEGQNVWHTSLQDLSLKGALVKKPDGWHHTDNKLCMSFTLSQSDVNIGMDVYCVGDAEDTLHLKCDSIDIESVSHLRRLLELNLSDSDLLNRELEQLTTP